MNKRYELSFRMPLDVTEVNVYHEDDYYPRCPRCRLSIEREFMRYCDRCGQRLSWKRFHDVRLIVKNKVAKND